eukprot:6419-Heterococcus_DN1.PRE.1
MSLGAAPTSTINILIGQQQQQQPAVALQQVPGILSKLLACFPNNGARNDPAAPAATLLPAQFITKVMYAAFS